ncbi:branched-chain amino acid transport system II carrier protein [Secundilactobacillus oryzae]|nr:branched-chain amino acid transport system II carrier protein [Secundilactobacillus oryzae]
MENEKKLTMKHYLLIASMLFGMFFGAGNLIFPIHLGQLAGAHWLTAGLGFLISGTLLPLLAIIAISVTHSNGIYELAKPIGNRYATIFMILVCLTLGPLFATPRTATVPFQIGIGNYINPSQTPIFLLIYSIIFFGITYWASSTPTGIIDSIGKLLNPAFLILLAIMFGFTFTRPMGTAGKMAASGTAYQDGSFLNGFLQGYNTMDAIAGLLFGIAIVSTIKGLGQRKSSHISATIFKSGALGIGLEAIIYLILIWVGATSLNHFPISADGGIAFGQIANHYLGLGGQIILAIMATLTCLTTSVGLSTSFSEALHNKFPQISYRTWNILTCGLSFIIANFGLETIIAWSTPMLMFLYPLAITLILLSILSPLFKRNSIVYIWTTAFTLIPAFLGMIESAPAIISKTAFAQALMHFDKMYLPLASYGLDWVVPALIGFALGLANYFTKGWLTTQMTQPNENN